jgi:drug/metabolite transporter (DMT)-like permease
MAGLAMTAFAGNSLLCRFALQQRGMDAASFTLIRLLAGSLMLGLITAPRLPFTRATGSHARSWIAALALFGTVQIGLLGHGWWQGERLYRLQVAGLVAAGAGLIGLLLPGVAAPPAQGALLMVTAGGAWATYTAMGRSTTRPLEQRGDPGGDRQWGRGFGPGLCPLVSPPAASGRDRGGQPSAQRAGPYRLGGRSLAG